MVANEDVLRKAVEQFGGGLLMFLDLHKIRLILERQAVSTPPAAHGGE